MEHTVRESSIDSLGLTAWRRIGRPVGATMGSLAAVLDDFVTATGMGFVMPAQRTASLLEAGR
jgi:hypothetical protein